jgi:DNA-binding response OmpR family regulator
VHGLELVRALKMAAPQLPIIVISALDPIPWAEAAAEAGASHFMSKPLRLETLRHEVAMVDRARALLYVVIADGDTMHAARLSHAFMGSGCHVTLAHSAGDIVASLGRPRAPHLVIVDGALPGADEVVRGCSGKGVTCFVLATMGRPVDDPWLRAGASLVVPRPVDPDALLAQARFLAFA